MFHIYLSKYKHSSPSRDSIFTRLRKILIVRVASNPMNQCIIYKYMDWFQTVFCTPLSLHTVDIGLFTRSQFAHKPQAVGQRQTVVWRGGTTVWRGRTVVWRGRTTVWRGRTAVWRGERQSGEGEHLNYTRRRLCPFWALILIWSFFLRFWISYYFNT